MILSEWLTFVVGSTFEPNWRNIRMPRKRGRDAEECLQDPRLWGLYILHSVDGCRPFPLNTNIQALWPRAPNTKIAFLTLCFHIPN